MGGGSRRYFKRHAAGIAAASLLLAACAGRDPYVTSSNTTTAGDWHIERQADRVTGKPISSALLVTRKVANSSVIFPKPAQLQLLCFKDQPAVRIAFAFKI